MKVRRIILAIGLAAFAVALPLQSADWPQYRGPAGDGTSSQKMPNWPANGLRALWKVPTPKGFSSFAILSLIHI